MTDFPPDRPKYQRLWAIADRFFDNDCKDAEALAKEVVSIEAALERRKRVDAVVEAIENQWRREQEAKERQSKVTTLAVKAFMVVSSLVGLLVGVQAVGRWWGFWP